MLLLTKSVFAVMIGFLASTFIGLILIPKLKKMHAGQHVSVFLASAHKQKEGTPTMGGLIFILSTTITILLLIITNKIDYTSNLLIVLLSFLGFGLIGFIDDFLSLRKKGNEGLTTYQKLFMQVKKNKELSAEFETWKKQAKEKINDMKKGKLTEDEVYTWIITNK